MGSMMSALIETHRKRRIVLNLDCYGIGTIKAEKLDSDS